MNKGLWHWFCLAMSFHHCVYTLDRALVLPKQSHGKANAVWFFHSHPSSQSGQEFVICSSVPVTSPLIFIGRCRGVFDVYGQMQTDSPQLNIHLRDGTVNAEMPSLACKLPIRRFYGLVENQTQSSQFRGMCTTSAPSWQMSGRQGLNLRTCKSLRAIPFRLVPSNLFSSQCHRYMALVIVPKTRDLRDTY